MSSQTSVNPDLAKERKTASFDRENLTEVIYGGKESVRRRRYLQNLAIQDRYLQSFPPWWNMDRETQYDVAVKKAASNQENNPLGLHQAMFIPTIEKQGTKEQIEKYVTPAKQAASNQETNPLGLHQIMFIPTIEKQGTKEQIEKYVTPAKQGLETMATYDPASEEFVINSPTITSMKYWPGSLGKTCNYVILMAQLYTKGKKMGIHAFVVQIRSLQDHKPMPGVTLGDIGNKLGYEGMDNGFLMFNNYRVPRDAMLMRYAKVERDGTYVAPRNAKIAYGSMVYIRALIVGDMGRSCAQASTIATRYSAVRRQTEIRPGGPEPQVIDYQTQQEKLFPMIAASYGLYFTGIFMGLEYNRLRRACGGHGYTNASGLGKIWANITPACTYEGENTVMYLQCARYLVKVYALVATGKQLPGFMSYLNRSGKQQSSLTQALNMEDFVDLYEHTAARLIKVVAIRLQALLKSGTSVEEARNLCGVQMVQAAKMHSYAYTVRTFNAVIQARASDPNVAKALTSLCQLFAVNGILQRLGDFLQDGYLSGQQAAMLADKQLALFADIRPNAVALVDAFDYPDQVLGSCLGRYDGNVYEALYEYAKNSPLNKQDIHDNTFLTIVIVDDFINCLFIYIKMKKAYLYK
ncbi:ACOX1-like protein [Mya arenaria]|uniref:Acyl-coenzyme A oxidase n=1 Tax=Mya arenaria TaxID=6604 RepID=A0ABY7F6R7_MYAAR|nr:ACOX1-like protein [Mya arenaria]